MAKKDEFSTRTGMKVVTRSLYIGGLIVDTEAEETWLVEKVQGRVELVNILSGVSHNHP